jgi:hypothetical protein
MLMEIGMLQSFRASMGDATWSDACRDRVEEQIIRAYMRLALTDDADGSRTVTLARLSSLEVRLTEIPRTELAGVPPFWLEICSPWTGSTLDSLGCFEFDEHELEVAVDFICDAELRHQTWN